MQKEKLYHFINYRRLVFLITLLVTLAFPNYFVHAKVTLGGSEMQTIHVNTVKGFLHFSLSNYSIKKVKKWGPRYARSAKWLHVLHESERIYELGELNGPEVKLILAAIAVISRVVNDEMPNLPVNESLMTWSDIGSRLKIEYSKKNGKALWKYELPKKSKKKKPKRSKKFRKKSSKDRPSSTDKQK